MSDITNTSEQWFERAKKSIPGGVHSPVRSFSHVGGSPVYFERAAGPYLYDVAGQEYLDFCLSFGPHILGHGDADILAAVSAQLEKAMSFGACHPGEVELSELILQAYPFLGKVRLVNSGTEAVMTAVRIARGFTSRNKVLQFEGCYHGHSDGLLAKAGSGVAALSESSSQGIPNSIVEQTITATYGDVEQVQKIFEKWGTDIAAIVLEPIPANNGLWPTPKAFLESILDIAHSHGALVIFDEVITGFRVGPSGASGHYDLNPDMVTLGKIIGGGLPLAAVVARQEILDCLAPLGGVYQAGTLSGNPLATAAGCAVLKKLKDEPPYAALETNTRQFAADLEQLIQTRYPCRVHSVASMFWIDFSNQPAFPPVIDAEGKRKYAELFKAGLNSGIYLAPSPFEVGFLSTKHTPEILQQALERLQRHWG